MRDARLTQDDLAQALGVSRSLVGHWASGQRRPDAEAVGEIAKALRVDAGWLRGDPAMVESKATTEWVFPQPIPGQRDYGNANIWTVPADVKTEVREAGQNIKDAHDGKSRSVVMRMRVIELCGPEVAEFKAAAGWLELEAHIEAASGPGTKGKLSRKLAAGLARVRANSERLILLRIDDFGTTGLTGPEAGKGTFAALVRNNLDTDKSSTSAGGSFGLGKAAHWRCSDVSTVFFNTVTPDHRARVIARSELAYHEIGGDVTGQHAGPGWFGTKGGNGYVESVNDENLARKLRLEREPLPPELRARIATEFGTSILVVAFQNPASEDLDDPAALVGEIEKEIAINFWPALKSNRLAAIVEHEVNGHVRDTRIVDPSRFVPEHCALLDRYWNGTTTESFENPGDVVAVPVPARIPRCKVERDDVLKHAAIDGEATLLVALPDIDATASLRSSLVNTVAMLRGPLMVTQYMTKAGIMVGARPFIAVLLAGEASGSDSPNKYIEQFLRASEPPAHDKWAYTDDLREMYERGAKARLEEFLGRNVNEALRKVLRVPDKSESDGPAELKRLLNLGGGPGGEAREALAMLRNVRPRFLGDHWEIKADVLLSKSRPDRLLKVEPYLALNAETGRPVAIPWATLEVLPPAQGISSTGYGFVVAKAVSRFTFKAITHTQDLPVDPARCTARVALKLEVTK